MMLKRHMAVSDRQGSYYLSKASKCSQ